MSLRKIATACRSRKYFISDVFLNLIASLAVSGIMQLFIYPYLSRILGAEEYGKFLTLIGISNIVAVTLGNSLNNVRLLRELEYQSQGVKGDFNALAAFSELSILVLIPLCVAFFHENIVSTMLICGISFLTCFRAYYSVGFRIILNYKKVLVQSLLYCAGGAVGLLFVRKTGYWQCPFIVAELFAGIYIFRSCGLIFESRRKTGLFRDTVRDYGYLIVTTLLANALTYLDRLLLYPLMGGQNVSIYYTSTFFGKTIGIALTPMAGVLLSYYSKKHSLTRKQFWRQNGLLILLCILFYVATLKLSVPFTGILYPSFIAEAKRFLPIGNLAAILLAASSVVQPAVLKFCKTVYQPVIQVIHLLVYIGLGLLFLSRWGLMGFCVAALLANTVKLVLLLMVGHFSLRGEGGCYRYAE